MRPSTPHTWSPRLPTWYRFDPATTVRRAAFAQDLGSAPRPTALKIAKATAVKDTVESAVGVEVPPPAGSVTTNVGTTKSGTEGPLRTAAMPATGPFISPTASKVLELTEAIEKARHDPKPKAK